MLLYHIVCEGRDRAESLVKRGLEDEPRYRSGPAPEQNGASEGGVWLTDDPVSSYEHVGCHVIRVELTCSLDELAQFEDLQIEGCTTHAGRLLEDAWFEHHIPLIATTFRDWFVPAEWLRTRTVKLALCEYDPDTLWRDVAQSRRPSPKAHLEDPTEYRLAVLARALHGRPYDGHRYDEDARPGALAIQESVALTHFDHLVVRLAQLGIPLTQCGWLLAEAARRVAIDSARLGEEHRQLRAAKWKALDAEARDDAEVKREAERLSEQGVSVAHTRRLLVAKFGKDRVPSEVVIRRRWLQYRAIRKRTL